VLHYASKIVNFCCSIDEKDMTSLSNQLYYWDSIFSEEACQRYFEHFATLPSLQQGKIHMFGKQIHTPRLESFHCIKPISYRYSGQELKANPFTEPLHEILQRVIEVTGYPYNSVLINLYRNGMDSNGWHADNEKELGENPVIASVSFGAERTFKLKSNTGDEKHSILLSNGSILLMEGKTQHEYKHCIPKEPKVLEPRINLTFRTIFELK
jgi:alkylated DNA repair dioxygenase AlkB